MPSEISLAPPDLLIPYRFRFNAYPAKESRASGIFPFVLKLFNMNKGFHFFAPVFFIREAPVFELR